MLIITFKYRYRKQIIIGVFILILLVGGTTLTIFMLQSNKKDKSDIVVSTSTKERIKRAVKTIEEELEARIKYFNDTYGEVALGADYKNLNKIKMKFFDLPMVNYSSIISAFVKNVDKQKMRK